MGEHELLLDPAIRDWVLIPIVIIMFLMGLLRNNVTKLMRKDTPAKREQIKINNQLMRCRRLRANGHYLPPNAFHARKGFFCEKEKGVLMVKQVPSPLLRLLLRRRRLLCRRPPPSPSPPRALGPPTSVRAHTPVHQPRSQPVARLLAPARHRARHPTQLPQPWAPWSSSARTLAWTLAPPGPSPRG